MKVIWPSWQSTIAFKLHKKLTDNSIDLLNKQVTDLLVKTSEDIFGFSKPKERKRNSIPGWNANCEKAWLEKKKRNQYARNLTINNKIEMNRATAFKKKTILQETREGWKKIN